MGFPFAAVTASRARPLGAVAFVPTDIAGLQLWLDASLIVGLADSDPVSTWADASGNGRDATAVDATRPIYKTGIINGKPVVRFDGTDDFMDLGDNVGDDKATYTLVVVARRTTYTAQQPWLSNRHLANSETDTYYGIAGTGEQFVYQDSAVPPPIVGASALTNGNAYALMLVVTPAARQLYLAGAANGDDAATNTATKIFSGYIGKDTGTGDFLNGDIAELLTYDAALDVSQRAALFAYTLGKWGV